MAQLYIGVGSNIDKEHTIPRALVLLKQYYPNMLVSPVYESAPVGFSGDNFFNLVIATETQETLEQTCNFLKTMEQDFGRTDFTKKPGDRKLDLDVLMFDQFICEEPAQLPRLEITKNAFVLWPFADIAPDLLHPLENKTLGELRRNYPRNKQKLWPVSLEY